MAAKLVGGEGFTLDDFLEQLIAIRRMGPISNILSMMPGMGQMKDQMAEVDDKHLDRVTAIIRSMTPGERTTPKIINGSRRVRIARGSGTSVTDVNQLLDRFADAQKMMKQMGGMMGMPGRRKATKSPKNKRKGKKGKQQSGNRAARAGGMPRLPGGMPQLPGGMPAGGSDQGLPDGFQMPKIDFSQLGNKRNKG
jgi:signal recognition particle subunit SRP54